MSCCGWYYRQCGSTFCKICYFENYDFLTWPELNMHMGIGWNNFPNGGAIVVSVLIQIIASDFDYVRFFQLCWISTLKTSLLFKTSIQNLSTRSVSLTALDTLIGVMWSPSSLGLKSTQDILGWMRWRSKIEIENVEPCQEQLKQILIVCLLQYLEWVWWRSTPERLVKVSDISSSRTKPQGLTKRL